MTQRFRGWLPLLLFALVVCLLAVSLRYRKSPLERFRECIVIGSTRAEVEDALGGPPGDYNTGEYFWTPLGLGYWEYDHWRFDGYEIVVEFDEGEKVARYEVFDHLPLLYRQSFWERISGR